MVYTGQFSAPRDLVFLLPLYALLIPFIIWNTIRRTRWLVKNAVETYELTLDELQITRIQRECPTMVILRNEVHRIAERTGQGIRIESSDSGKNIWVPKELEGYEEVKTLLLSTTPACCLLFPVPSLCPLCLCGEKVLPLALKLETRNPKLETPLQFCFLFLALPILAMIGRIVTVCR